MFTTCDPTLGWRRLTMYATTVPFLHFVTDTFDFVHLQMKGSFVYVPTTVQLKRSLIVHIPGAFWIFDLTIFNVAVFFLGPLRIHAPITRFGHRLFLPRFGFDGIDRLRFPRQSGVFWAWLPWDLFGYSYGVLTFFSDSQ